MPSADVDDATTQRETPSAIMVNAEGEYVVAEPDKASWESYQQKAAKSSTKTTDAEGSKELQELGLECTVDHKLIKDAVKTPCCGKVYCEDCIQNLLFETDFVCPNCDTKDILLDRLVVDTETREKVEAYEKGIRNGAGAQKPKSVSPTLIDATNGNSGTAAGTVVAAPSNQSNNPTTTSASNQQKQTGQPIQSVSTVIPIVKTAQLQQQQVQPQQQQGQPLQQKIPSIDSTGTTLPISKKRPFEENEDVSTPQIPTGPAALRSNNILNQSEQLRTIKPQPIQKYPQPTPPQPIPSQQYSQNQAIYNRPAYSHQNQFQPGYNNYNQYPSNGMNGYYGNGNGPNHYAPPNGGMMGNGMNNGLGMNMGMGNMGNMGMGQNAPTGMGPGMNMNMRTGMGPNTNGMGNGMGGNMVNGPQNMGMNGMGNRVPNMMAMGMNGMGINGMGMNGMGNGMMNGMPNGIMGPGNMNQMNSQMGYQYGMDPSSYYFSNQQKTVFSEAFPSEEESAYIRKPVNPHRHARPKRIRPSDFKALGGE